MTVPTSRSDDPPADGVGDRRVRERHHRFALADALLRDPCPAAGGGCRGSCTARPCSCIRAVARSSALVSRAARPGADDGEQVDPLERHRVDRHDVAVLEALERDLVERNRSWPLRKSVRRSPNIVTLAVIVQSSANPRNSTPCMVPARYAARARGDHGTFVPAARRPYSLISSGPSGTSMRTRPSSTTTG